ncbi:MAG TPA: hypothetical protein VJ372_17595 [Pyrinomonadaceae bacterium]|jgi:hypothetical protein|nr:hypothetical protein [Pyrinomonadaceae bacterium]
MLEAWRRTGSQSLGAAELASIQESLRSVFGQSSIKSPASLARALADSGVPLRHPEVLQADTVWREANVYEFFGPGDLDFTSLELALASVTKIEDLRIQIATEGDETGVKRLTQHIQELRRELDSKEGELVREVVQWLKVWLQNPVVFRDWLSLRQKSADFLQKFAH